MATMDATAYRAQIARLGLSQGGAARVVGVDARTSRRWALGEMPVPGPVQRLLWACERWPELLAALRDTWAEGEAGDERS